MMATILQFFLLYCTSVRVASCFQVQPKTSPRRSALHATEERRQRHSIRLPTSGNEATLLSRTVPITTECSLTVWEWENPAQVIESYWEAQRQNDVLVRDSRKLLDPFGIVSWPGSVVAAQELHRHAAEAVQDRSVLIVGAGVGLEAQAAALCGAKQVLATDIHPTTLQQLEFGVERADAIENKSVVQTEILDLYAHEEQPIPNCDLLIVADVLYNEELADQVRRRIVEAWVQNPKIKVLVTDSQRFVPAFWQDLGDELEKLGGAPCEWQEETLQAFTGSGVMINEDQTYDVKVRKLWIGLQHS